MYFDLNIDESFENFAELENVDTKGFCMVLSSQSSTSLDVKCTKPIYTRTNTNYHNRLDQMAMANLAKFDLVCIQGVNSSNLSSVVKLDPDLITIDLDEIKHIKKSFINTLKEKNIYIEMTVRNALYISKDKIRWMNAIRRLIRLGCTKNLVLSTGATVFTELKSSNDMCKILGIFQLSEDSVKKILNNSEDVLRKAALKRYSSRGIIATNQDEGRLKTDFILNYPRN